MKFFYVFFLCLTTINICAVKLQGMYFPTTDFRSSYPYISGCTVREIADFRLDPTSNFSPDEIKAGDVVFVMIDYLEDFLTLYHPYIKEPYILLMHNFFGESDDPVPGKWTAYLDDEKILAWFAINPSTVHPKLHPMPIGIASAFYTHGNTSIFDECISQYANIIKNNLLYMNFSLWTNREYRTKVYNLFVDKKFVTQNGSLDLRSYLINVAHHKFVLSPRGHGLDCHRTWEALLMKSFPIFETSTLDCLYEDLPVVIIQNWEEVTEDFLNKKYKEIIAEGKEYNWQKLYMPYWIEKIEKIKKNAKKYRV